MNFQMHPLQAPELLREACFLAGQWRESDAVINVLNPMTGDTVARVPRMGESETAEAIAAAQAAGKAWARRPASERAQILRRWFDLVRSHKEDLALILTLEQGKPLREARAEIDYAASYIEWFSEEARRAYGDIIPSADATVRQLVLREPVGVCAAITPWNFPSGMVTRNVAPALAAGCTMILKPAEQTPLSALALAYLAELAGVPAGVLQVLTGPSRVIGSVLTASPAVRKLTFTGSTEVGRVLAAQCAPTLKKLSLELGGNAPFIVFADADLDRAVEGALQSKFRNSGQTCVCTNRLLVQRSVHAEFAQRLAQRLRTFRVGDGMAQDTDQGPLIDQAAFHRIDGLVKDAVARGGKVLVGGSPAEGGGLCYLPTLIEHASLDSRLATEEIFGPLAGIFNFDTEEEAIALANDTEYGLAGYVFTRSLARAWRVGEALECGMVGVNTGLISSAAVPFGGIKQSGFGREGSKYGLDDYTELKYMCIAGLDSAI